MTTPGLILDAANSEIKAPTTLTFDSDINFNQHQALQFRVENIVTPSAGHAGRLIIDGTILKYDDGSAFKTISTPFTGDTATTVQGYLNSSGGVVLFRDDDGLTIANSANTQSVNVATSNTNEITVSGSIVVNGSIKSSTLTANQIVYVGVAGLLQDSTNFTYDGVAFIAKAVTTFSSNSGVSFQSADLTEGLKIRTMHVSTSDDTPTELTFDGTAASGGNTLVLTNNTTHGFAVWVTTRCTAGSNVGLSAMFRFEFVGNGDSGTAALVGGSATETVIARDIASWDVSVSVTGSRIQIFVTGDASSTLHWTAQVQETIVF